MPDEKFDEKEMEKRDEKAPEEKSWDEKYRRDPLNPILWACVFIWAGLVFMASTTGLLDRLQIRSTDIPGLTGLHLESWSLVLIGAGVIVLIGVAVRLVSPAYRRPIAGAVLLGIFLIGVGLGDLVGISVVWPLLLITLGVLVLLRGFWRSGRSSSDRQ